MIHSFLCYCIVDIDILIVLYWWCYCWYLLLLLCYCYCYSNVFVDDDIDDIHYLFIVVIIVVVWYIVIVLYCWLMVLSAWPSLSSLSVRTVFIDWRLFRGCRRYLHCYWLTLCSISLQWLASIVMIDDDCLVSIVRGIVMIYCIVICILQLLFVTETVVFHLVRLTFVHCYWCVFCTTYCHWYMNCCWCRCCCYCVMSIVVFIQYYSDTVITLWWYCYDCYCYWYHWWYCSIVIFCWPDMLKNFIDLYWCYIVVIIVWYYCCYCSICCFLCWWLCRYSIVVVVDWYLFIDIAEMHLLSFRYSAIGDRIVGCSVMMMQIRLQWWYLMHCYCCCCDAVDTCRGSMMIVMTGGCSDCYCYCICYYSLTVYCISWWLCSLRWYLQLEILIHCCLLIGYCCVPDVNYLIVLFDEYILSLIFSTFICPHYYSYSILLFVPFLLDHSLYSSFDAVTDDIIGGYDISCRSCLLKWLLFIVCWWVFSMTCCISWQYLLLVTVCSWYRHSCDCLTFVCYFSGTKSGVYWSLWCMIMMILMILLYLCWLEVLTTLLYSALPLISSWYLTWYDIRYIQMSVLVIVCVVWKYIHSGWYWCSVTDVVIMTVLLKAIVDCHSCSDAVMRWPVGSMHSAMPLLCDILCWCV